MGTLTYTSAYYNMWNSTAEKYRYYGEVQLTTSRSVSSNQYTVSVTGIRAYGGEWNFTTHYTITLAGQTVTGSIKPSGNNNYNGWIPSSGYNPVSLSVTVNGNISDGTCPDIYLSFTCYNNKVKWKNESIRRGYDVFIAPKSVYSATNIKADVEYSSDGPNDRTAPTITATKVSTKPTSITFSGSSNPYTCKDWQYAFGGQWNKCDWGTSTGGSTTLSVTEGTHLVQLYAVRSDNNVQGYSNTLTFDTNRPTISNESMTALSATKATVTFTTNYACSYEIYNSAGTKLGSGTTTANQSVSKEVTTDGNDATYTIKAYRTSDLYAEKSVYCYSYIPQVSKFQVKPLSATKARVTVNCDCKFYCCVKRPDGKLYAASGQDKYQGEYSAGTDHVFDIDVLSTSGTYTLYVERAVNRRLVNNSKTTTCDTRLPSISVFRVTPSSYDGNTAKGKLTLTTDFSCNWVLNTDATPQSNGTVNTSITDVEVLVDGNKTKKYKVSVARTSCAALTAEAWTEGAVDTTPAVLRFSNIKTVANTCSFTVSSDDNCRSWQAALYQGDAVMLDYRTIHNGGAKSVTYTFNNVTMNVPFTIRVKAVKSSNGAHSSVESESFTCYGIGYVCTSVTREGPVFSPSTVYVYDGNNWKPAVPYVYDGISWKYGTITF